MTDVFIVIIVLLLVGGAVSYIIKEKKRGAKCIGCPSGGCCMPAASEKKKLTNVVNEKKLVLQGLHCEGCKIALEKAINDLEGASAEVNLKEQTLTVSMEKEITDEILTHVVMRAGFAVVRIEQA